MPKLNLSELALQRAEVGALSEVKLLSAEHADSPFARHGYAADDWKAYVQFRINHSMPVVAGPLQSGNYTAYHPGVIERSHPALLHQQVNLRHLVKSYDPKNIARDRIVGAVVGTYFPPGMGGQVPKSKAEAVPITCLVAVFKQAEGVNRLLGDHLASRQEWSGSIETVFNISECGLYLASDGSVTPILDATEEMWKGISRAPSGLKVGRVGGTAAGEQMVIAPGAVSGTISYQGLGFTPNPAEREARIEEVRAEMMGEGCMAIAAERVPLAMFPRGVRWIDASGLTQWAEVLQVHAEAGALVKLDRDRRHVCPGNPILHCRMRQGRELLRSLRSVFP